MTFIASVLEISPWEAYHLLVGIALGLGFGFMGGVLFAHHVVRGLPTADQVVRWTLGSWR